MKLFYTNRSPYARKVQVVALEKNIDLELCEVDLSAKSADLISANPLGKIPTLVTDEGAAICDSTLICEYLEVQHPQPALMPVGGVRWKVANLDAVAKSLADNTVAIFLEKLIHPKDFHARFVSLKEESIVRTLEYFEENISSLEDFNIASISVACAIGYIQFRLSHLWPQNSCQRLGQWYDEISRRDSFVQTVPVE